MNDYDIYLVPHFPLDNNFNYDIKLVLPKPLSNQQLIDKLFELDIVEDLYFKCRTKSLFVTSVSCLDDLKKWLIQLADIFTELNIRSNLDSKLLEKINVKNK